MPWEIMGVKKNLQFRLPYIAQAHPEKQYLDGN
jgi:hypothetical protein